MNEMETVVAKIIFGVGEDGFVYGSKDWSDVYHVRGNRIKDVYDLHRSEGTRLNSSHLCISYAVFCLKK